jgi:hypothetical protein
VTMAAGWCGERAPRPWWGHMEIRPDHWWEKVGQGAPPRRGERGGRSLGGCTTTHTTPTTTSSVTSAATTRPPSLGPGGRSTEEGGRQRGGGRLWGCDECARGRGRRRGRSRWVVAAGELLQGEGITDLQEGGWQVLVREQRPHDLVAAGRPRRTLRTRTCYGIVKPRSRSPYAMLFILQQ